MKKNKFNPIIQTTTNYSQFKLVFGNRRINYAHVKRLKRSFEENPLVSIIIVNDRMQIIDGQHRFCALKELGMPINYLIVNGYGKTQVQIYNVNNSTWKKNDYLQSYVDEGNENYIIFKKFMDTYPDLSMGHCIKILSGFNSTDRYSTIEGVKTTMKDFEYGKFEVKDLSKAHRTAQMILDFKPYFNRFNDNAFILALLTLFENPEYDHEDMIKKLSFQTGSLKVCKMKSQYIELLESIYNYKRRGKVNLRFAN